MRAAYAALVLGLIGGLGLATVVLSGVRPPPSTVAAALGVVDGPVLDERRASAVAMLTAACMRDHGFEWAAVPDRVPSIPDATLDPIAWADRWGFGVSTTADQPATSPAPDPNLAAVERMPAATQTEVRAALHGSPSEPGCAERARREVYGLRERALEPLQPELDRLAAAIDADVGVTAAVATWRGCVASVSHGESLDRRTLTGSLIDRAVDALDGVRAGRADLATVQRQERQSAGVLARCEQAFDAERERVAARHEAVFVARYRDRLEGIGAAIRSAEAAWPSSSQ